MENKREIETPFGKHKVVVKEWITGEDREYIDEPLYGAVNAKPKVIGKTTSFDVGTIDMKTFLKESTRRGIEKFVISIDGSTDDIVNRVMQMHEKDTEFIKNEIGEKDEDEPVKKEGATG